MDLQLAGMVVVVSGGCHGIGRAIVEAFLGEGARVVVGDRDAAAGADLVARRGAAADVAFAAGDLADPAVCARLAALAVGRFGGIDVLVNNVGRNDGVGLDGDVDAFLGSLRANVGGAFALLRAALPSLRARRGAVVNIGSKVAVTGQGGTSGYAAAKGAMLALTREWALELADDGVRVNAVCPAEVWTPMYEQWLAGCADPAAERARIERSIPLGRRFTTAREIADSVVFVASPRASHTTGQVLFVDGGYVHLDRRWTPTTS
ncbi:MAG: SDR family oxidoreductase [Planctomycetes bacterium]|nr:SDR family oxidoreductase [Planctomycetota bacterium]